MAAMPLATPREGFRGMAFHDPRTPLQKIGLDKGNAEQEEVYNMLTVEEKRCDAVCMEPGADRKASAPFTSLRTIKYTHNSSRSLLLSLHAAEPGAHLPSPYDDSPPSYEEAVLDTPPDYSSEDLAQAKVVTQPDIDPLVTYCSRLILRVFALLRSMSLPIIDFEDASNIRSHAKKKDKKAANAANKAKWTGGGGSDDEGKKDGEEGGDNGGGEEGGGGGGGGGSNNGDGGGAGGDGGGDDWNNFGGGKKNKKKKKKGAVDEEEEQKKQEEEEEERKRKEEEEATAAQSKTDPLSWADEQANGDDWGTGSTWNTGKIKKKGGKKAKQEEEAAEKKRKEEEEAAEKKKEEEEAEAEATATAKRNPKSLPWDDLEGKKDDDDGFSGWGTNKNKKKNKKGKNDPGPEKPAADKFDEINLDGEAPKIDLSFDTGTKDKSSSDFGFGGWGSTFTNKWSSSFGTTDTTGTDITETNTAKDAKPTSVTSESNVWSFSGNSKKKKTTMSNDYTDFSPLDEVKEEKDDSAKVAVGDDSWNSFNPVIKKEKKGNKKNLVEEVSPEPAIINVPDIVMANDDLFPTWSKKTNPRRKSNANDTPLVPSVPPPIPVSPPEDPWATSDDKKKKKGKIGVAITKVEEPIAELDAQPTTTTFDNWTSPSNKKSKKGKKVHTEEEPAPPPEPEPEPYSPASSKKDKKKSQKGETTTVEDLPIIDVTVNTATDGTWDSWGTSPKKDKKSKKAADVEMDDDLYGSGDIGVSTENKPEPLDDLMDWTTTTKKKDTKISKAKKGSVGETNKGDSIPPPPPPAAPNTFDFLDSTPWDTPSNDKAKKSKKATEPAVVFIPEKSEEQIAEESEEEFKNSIKNLSTKVRLKKEKERKAKKEEARKKKEKEEEEEKQKEAERLKAEEEELLNSELADSTDEEKKDELEREEREKKEKEEAEAAKKKEKKKFGSWSTSFGSEKPSKTKDLLAGSVADSSKPAEKGIWGNSNEIDTWGTTKSGDKDGWGSTWDSYKTTDKKKTGKSSFGFEAPPPAPTPPAQGLTPEPEAPVEDISTTWGSYGTKSKNKPKKNELTKTISGTSASKDRATTDSWGDNTMDLLSTLDDYSGDKSKGSAKKEADKEPAAKAARNFWSSQGATPSSKPGGGKNTAKDKSDEKVSKDKEVTSTFDASFNFDFGTIDDDNTNNNPPAPAKNNKTMMGNSLKLTRTTSKGSDKASDAASDKWGKADDKKKKSDLDALIDIVEETPANIYNNIEAKGKKEDAWGFWNTAKKPVGKKEKEKEKVEESKKEITKSDWTNQDSSLDELSTGPEATAADEAWRPSKTTTSTAKMTGSKFNSTAATTAGKSAAALSVQDRIRAFDKDKAKKAADAKTPAAAANSAPPPPPPAAPEPPQADVPLKKTSASSKLAKNSSFSTYGGPIKRKDLTPPKEPEKFVKDSLPGSFPSPEEGAGDDDDDDIVDVIESPPLEPILSKKEKKAGKKAKKAQQELEPMDDMNEMILDVPEAPEAPEPPPPGPPTPPPEPAKPAKKERARVVRDEGSGWGFWGAPPPKKEVKKQPKPVDEVLDVTPPSSKGKATSPSLNRSKSTKTPREAEKDEQMSRSSGSDKIQEKKVETPRPRQKVPASGFASLFGPPSRSKTTRRVTSTTVPKSTSRRQSVDVGSLGMPSPPPEDHPEMNEKAAKLLGTAGKPARKQSLKGKQRGADLHSKEKPRSNPRYIAIPDPYAIDDDDMIIVDEAGVPVVDDQPPSQDTPKASKRDKQSKSKRESKYAPEPADDIVMVEATPNADGPDVKSGPDDLAFVEKPRDRDPPPLRRSATTGTKKAPGLGGLFGSFRTTRRATEAFSSPIRSKGVSREIRDEPVDSRRRRREAPVEDSPKRVRREDRRVYRSDDYDREVADVAPNGGGSTEAEDAARRERRAQRAKDKASKSSRTAEKAEEERKARDLLNDEAAREERRAKILAMREQKAKEDAEKAAEKEEDDILDAEKPDKDKDDVLDPMDPVDPVDEKAKSPREGSASREPDRDLDEPPLDRERERRRKHRDRDHDRDYYDDRDRKSSRRRSYIDGALPTRTREEESSRRRDRDRRDDRKSSRRDEPKSSSRRKASVPDPVDDYFDPRNGTTTRSGGKDKDIIEEEPVATYPPKGPTDPNDHTSSWVNSQIIEPPPPPPIEPTVIEPTPILGEVDDEARSPGKDDDRKRRSSKRRSRYVDDVEGDERRRRRERREREKRGEKESRSGGSDERDREKDRDRDRDRGRGDRDRDRDRKRRSEYVSTGRPVAALATGGRRDSWLKKFGI